LNGLLPVFKWFIAGFMLDFCRFYKSFIAGFLDLQLIFLPFITGSCLFFAGFCRFISGYCRFIICLLIFAIYCRSFKSLFRFAINIFAGLLPVIVVCCRFYQFLPAF